MVRKNIMAERAYWNRLAQLMEARKKKDSISALLGFLNLSLLLHLGSQPLVQCHPHSR
jgi:hypothetical protein